MKIFPLACGREMYPIAADSDRDPSHIMASGVPLHMLVPYVKEYSCDSTNDVVGAVDKLLRRSYSLELTLHAASHDVHLLFETRNVTSSRSSQLWTTLSPASRSRLSSATRNTAGENVFIFLSSDPRIYYSDR